MVIKKVEKNGNYIHLGFFINGTPIQVFNEDESVKSIKGISYLVFKKDNEFYYVKNTSFLGVDDITPYGNFQKYLNANFIDKSFELVMGNDVDGNEKIRAFLIDSKNIINE